MIGNWCSSFHHEGDNSRYEEGSYPTHTIAFQNKVAHTQSVPFFSRQVQIFRKHSISNNNTTYESLFAVFLSVCLTAENSTSSIVCKEKFYGKSQNRLKERRKC